jgi:ABC-type multidrug transport system fused ATPase/permease subunit
MGIHFPPQLTRFLRPYGLPFALLVLGGIVSTFSEGVGIGLLIPFLDFVFQTDPGATTGGWFTRTLKRFAGSIEADNRAVVLGGLIAGLILLRIVLRFGTTLLGLWIIGRISHDLRAAVSRQILEVAFGYVAQAGKGRLLNTVAHETWRVTEAVQQFWTAVSALIAVVVFTTVMLVISWQLTLLVMSGALLVSLVLRLIARHTSKIGRLAVEGNRELSDRMVAILDGVRVIRLFGQEAREIRRFADSSDTVRRRFLRLDVASVAMHPLMEALYLPLFFAALYLALLQSIGFSTLLAFLFIFYRMAPQARIFGQSLVRLSTLRAAVDDVTDLLDQTNKPQLRSGDRPFEKLQGELIFEKVSFAYESGNRLALSDVSFTLRRGEVLALFGRSGAGKSTIVNLLCRFYDPSAGRISVDGTALPDFDLAQWRGAIAIAGQGVELMGLSIADNIRYGRPGAEIDEIVAAAKEMHAHDFVEQLPQGYDTVLDRWHGTLSGGQRQRIALARALLRHPEILILDEATSELDSATEAMIQEVLKQLKGRMTIVIIAHRLSTIRNADHVVVLDEGRVVETGPPKDLLEREGSFARLAGLQAESGQVETES